MFASSHPTIQAMSYQHPCTYFGIFIGTTKLSVEIQNDLLNGLSAHWTCTMSTAPQILSALPAHTFVHAAAAHYICNMSELTTSLSGYRQCAMYTLHIELGARASLNTLNCNSCLCQPCDMQASTTGLIVASSNTHCFCS